MSAWIQKLNQFKAVLDAKVSDHKSNVDKVNSNLHTLAENAAAVQPRLMLEFTLVEPSLGKIPDGTNLRHATIYDIIQYNIIEALILEGQAHLETLDE